MSKPEIETKKTGLTAVAAGTSEGAKEGKGNEFIHSRRPWEHLLAIWISRKMAAIAVDGLVQWQK